MTISYSTTGLAAFQDALERLPDVAKKAAKLAVLDTAGFALAQAKREIRKQTNFPKKYLDAKLNIVSFPTEENPEAVLRGDFQPRSLASYATNRPSGFAKRYKIAPKLLVKPGKIAQSQNDRLFFMALKSGTQFDADNFNVGVALRLKKGESIRNTGAAFKPTKLPNVYLLYGPSVNQLFKDVAPAISGEVTDRLEREFDRQLRRLSGL